MDRFVSLAVAVTWHAKQKESREKRATHVLDFFSTFCRPISFCNPARIVPFFFRSNLLLYRAPFRAGNWFFFYLHWGISTSKVNGSRSKKRFFSRFGRTFLFGLPTIGLLCFFTIFFGYLTTLRWVQLVFLLWERGRGSLLQTLIA